EACVAHAEGVLQRDDELRPAVGVDAVITAAHTRCDALGTDRDGIAGGDGEHDHVAVGYDRRLHVLSRVVSFGDILVGNKSTAGVSEEGTKEWKLYHLVIECVDLLKLVLGTFQLLATMLLAIVEGQTDDVVAPHSYSMCQR